MTRALLAFLTAPASWRYGYDLMKQAELSSGTLYPLLARLSDEGWLESRWEESEFSGKPARQMYRLTGIGLQMAREVVSTARTEWIPSQLMPRSTT
jgi:PadR family transcriptional regulator, regulatory protein PadR